MKLTQIVRKFNEERINDKTKLTPILLLCAQARPNPGKCCAPVMFARFLRALLKFCARKFPANSVT